LKQHVIHVASSRSALAYLHTYCFTDKITVHNSYKSQEFKEETYNPLLPIVLS